MEFESCRVEFIVVGRIHDEDNSVHAMTVPLPHGPEFGLTCYIPYLESYGAFADFAIVERNGWNDVLRPLS